MPNFYNLLRARKFSSAADTAIEIAAYDSATPNFTIDAGGKLSWSSGSANADTNLYRSAANTLKTDDSFDLASGKTYKIDGSDVLTGSALGSGITQSSLTSVGNLSALTISGTTSIQQSFEKINLISDVPGGGTTAYVADGAVNYFTSPTNGNFSLFVTGSLTDSLDSLMSVGRSLTIVFLITNSTTAGALNDFKVDGQPVTIKWFGGSQPASGNTNAVDIYTFTIVKTASNTFTVFGSQSKFA